MSVNAADYQNFLTAWTRHGGPQPSNRKFLSVNGSAYVAAANRLGPEGVLGALDGADLTVGIVKFLSSIDDAVDAAEPIFAPPAEPVVVDTATKPDPQNSERIDMAFEELSAFWVPNRSYPEQPAAARSAFGAAVAVHGIEEVVRVCHYYAEQVSTGTVGMPRHLSSFLAAKVFQQWQTKAVSKISPEEIAAFEVAFAAYPEFALKDAKKAESREFYLQFVKHSDATDFLCSVVAYAEQVEDSRKGIESQVDYDGDGNEEVKVGGRFVYDFSRFAAQLWPHIPRRHVEVGDAVSYAWRIAAKANGHRIDPRQEMVFSDMDCVHSLCRGHATNPPGTVEATIRSVSAIMLPEATPEQINVITAAALPLAYAFQVDSAARYGRP
jgi:hypothetical protein